MWAHVLGVDGGQRGPQSDCRLAPDDLTSDVTLGVDVQPAGVLDLASLRGDLVHEVRVLVLDVLVEDLVEPLVVVASARQVDRLRDGVDVAVVVLPPLHLDSVVDDVFGVPGFELLVEVFVFLGFLVFLERGVLILLELVVVFDVADEVLVGVFAPFLKEFP